MKPLHVLLLLGLVLSPPTVAGQEAPEPFAAAANAEEPATETIAETPEPDVFDPEAFLAELEQRRLEAEARTRAAVLAVAGEIPALPCLALTTAPHGQ